MKLVPGPHRVHWLGEVIITVAAVGFAALGRAIIDIFAPGVLPFVLTFPAVIFASLLAGPRTGAAVAIVCQLLVWYFVLPPHRSFVLDSAEVVSLVFSTLSLGLTVWITGAYRAATGRLHEETQRRIDLLSLALKEVDHRTKNVFQIAASLLLSQAGAQKDATLTQELRIAASRLISIAAVYANLALSSADLSTVMLQDYLRELCARFRETMLPPTVTLGFEGDAVGVPAETATTIGLIVNECLTNAAKHAFPDGRGSVQVAIRRGAGEIFISVRDDGVGAASEKRGGGTGSALITTLTRTINGSFEACDEGGRRCTLRLPG